MNKCYLCKQKKDNLKAVPAVITWGNESMDLKADICEECLEAVKLAKTES